MQTILKQCPGNRWFLGWIASLMLAQPASPRDVLMSAEPMRIARHPGQTFVDASLAPDGKSLAIFKLDDGAVHIVKVETAETLQKLAIPISVSAQGQVKTAFSPDGKRLLALTTDPKASPKAYVQLWNTEDWQEVQSFRTAKLPVYASFALSKDGSRAVFYLRNDKSAALWDLKSAQLIETIRSDVDIIQCEFSPDGDHFAVIQSDRRTGRYQTSLYATEKPAAPVKSLDLEPGLSIVGFRPAGLELAGLCEPRRSSTGKTPGRIAFVRFGAGQDAAAPFEIQEDISSRDASGLYGPYLAIASRDRYKVYVHDVWGKSLRYEIAVPDQMQSAVMNSNGTRLLINDTHGATVWNLEAK